MKINRQILRYYGAKWNIAHWIISHFPSHDNYIELCGGSGAVLIQKSPSDFEVYNDIDSNVVNFFRVLRNNPEQLFETIKLTPYAREEYEYCRTPSNDSIENARRFFISCWMSISSAPFDKSTGWRSNSKANENYINHIITFNNAKNYFNLIADRFKYVKIENRDCRYVIKRYDNKNTLFYFDPPYVKETRVAKNQYKFEVDDQFHIDCAKLFKQCKGQVIVSGYNCPLYEKLYDGWKRFDKKAINNSGNVRMESIWLSPKIKKLISLNLL